MSNAIKSQGTAVSISTENANSTVYGSATFNAVGEVASVGEPSGEAADIDVTHLQSTGKEYLIGLPDEGNFQISGNWVPTDTGQAVLETARLDQNPRWLKVTFSNGTVRYAKGLVKKYAPSAAVDGKVPFSASIRTSGLWTTV